MKISNMNGFRFFITLSLVLNAINSGCMAQSKEGVIKKPNIVFILVDDLGWSDVGFLGSKNYSTPNVDKLAAQGMIFTDFYSGGPVCSPTRASILTGKSSARTGITTYLITPEKDQPFVSHHLELSEFTLGEAFNSNGYTTGYFGKWHLGYKSQHWVSNQGFDVAMGGCSSINAWKMLYPEREPPLDYLTQINYFSPYTATHIEDGPRGEYMTDRLTNETISFIQNSVEKEQPFFAFLAFHTVHTPLEAKEYWINFYKKQFEKQGILGFEDSDNGSRKYQNLPEYAAMVAHMDENVGRLLKSLKALGVEKNTIVVFTSDNGGKGTVTSNYPLRGAKHNLYEGGIRVPTIIKWKDRIKAGTNSKEPLISDDFYPTLLELSGIDLIPNQHIDGESFASILLGNSEAKEIHKALYWHYPHGVFQAAIRKNMYKLVYHYQTGDSELFNLEIDQSEQIDLSTKSPEITINMKIHLRNWLKDCDAKFPEDGIVYP